MAGNSERFTTPVMRLLQGSVDEPQTKDMQGRPRTVKSGPNTGQPNPQFFIAGAVAKNDPAWPEFWGAIVAKAAADFPALFPRGAQPHEPNGGCIRPDFAFKVVDGDSAIPNQAGRPWNSYEGFPGHWVVRFASAYPPRCFYAGKYAANEQIQEKNVIRRGYFIRVSGSMIGNGDQQKPGLYMNLDMVELSGYGPEIQSGPDAGQAFGAPPAALPAGASAAPLTPPATPPGAPPAAAAPPPPGGTLPAANTAYDPLAAAVGDGWAAHPTAPGFYYRGQEVVASADLAARYPAPSVATPAATAGPPPAPYTGDMAPPAAPAAPGPTPAGPAPAASPAPPAPGAASSPTASPTRVMLPAANGATYEQMIAAGWTDDTLRAHGMMQ